MPGKDSRSPNLDGALIVPARQDSFGHVVQRVDRPIVSQFLPPCDLKWSVKKRIDKHKHRYDRVKDGTIYACILSSRDKNELVIRKTRVETQQNFSGLKSYYAKKEKKGEGVEPSSTQTSSDI